MAGGAWRPRGGLALAPFGLLVLLAFLASSSSAQQPVENDPRREMSDQQKRFRERIDQREAENLLALLQAASFAAETAVPPDRRERIFVGMGNIFDVFEEVVFFADAVRKHGPVKRMCVRSSAAFIIMKRRPPPPPRFAPPLLARSPLPIAPLKNPNDSHAHAHAGASWDSTPATARWRCCTPTPTRRRHSSPSTRARRTRRPGGTRASPLFSGCTPGATPSCAGSAPTRCCPTLPMRRSRAATSSR